MEYRKNLRYEILTPEGFQPFRGIKRTSKNAMLHLKFNSGAELRVSEGHKLFSEDGTAIQAKDLKVGSSVLDTEGGLLSVTEILRLRGNFYLYDAIEVGTKHRYFTGNLLSSNCDCDFLTSGDTIFEFSDLEFYETTYVQDPVERRGIDGNYWIWERPDYTRSYLLSADVARGDGSDYSAFHVWDVETCTQVAEYKGKMTPKDYGAFLVAAATEYNNALLVCENASIGWATIEEILARGYQNLYYSTSGATETADSYASKLDRGKLTPGFTTSARTRPLVVAKIYDYVHEHACILKSKRLLVECRNFIWKNGRAEAQEGLNDDLVMSAAIGLYIRDTALQMRQQGLDLTRASMGAFGHLNRRDQSAVVSSNYYQMQNPYQITDPNGNQQDISWVLR